MRKTQQEIPRYRLECEFEKEPDSRSLVFENKSLSSDFTEFAQIMHRLQIGSGSRLHGEGSGIERAPEVGQITGALSANTRTRYAR
jgi:hypothetical protein